MRLQEAASRGSDKKEPEACSAAKDFAEHPDGLRSRKRPCLPDQDAEHGKQGRLPLHCVGYAWTEVEAPDETDAWLGIGSDDGLKVWLNGELVNDQWVARTSRLDDDVVPLRLKKGKNRFLIKIQNVKGLWSFTCRLRVRGK